MSKLFEALQRAGRPVPVTEPEPSALPAMIREKLNQRVIQNGVSAPTEPAQQPPARKTAPIRTVQVHLAEAAIFPFEKTNTSAAEQYRIIRTKILYARPTGSLILLSSAASGDGKTVTALNIAGAMALKNDSNILIVDGDLCRATLAKKLDIEQKLGLAEVLSGSCMLEEALVRIESIPNLYILPAGNAGEKRTELLEGPRWKSLCDVFRREFAYTVVDAPPIGALADYELLQASADGVVMVVRPDYTERGMCLSALNSVPKEKLIGVVFNAAEKSSISTDYGYYYTYYHYGSRKES